MINSDDFIELPFDEIITETAKGGILIDFGEKLVWLPKCALDLKDWSKIVGVPRHLAEEKGLI
jgi:hypothetical protein